MAVDGSQDPSRAGLTMAVDRSQDPSREVNKLLISVWQLTGHKTRQGRGIAKIDVHFYSGCLESMCIVTGPSFTNATCISAPKMPVCIFLQSTFSVSIINCS